MAGQPQASGYAWDGISRRRSLRFQLRAPLDITVLRAGVPDTVPGRTLNLCEGGIAAILAGELARGEKVKIELQLPSASKPLQAQAAVRYQADLRCGFEFLEPSEQRESILNWARQTQAEPEISATSAMKKNSDPKGNKDATTGVAGKRLKKWQRNGLAAALSVIVVAAGVFWWKWNRGWEKLESGLRTGENSSTQLPQVRVPAEIMQKLIIHRVDPVYPPEARKQKLQGVIAIDIVVGRDGSVLSMHPLNGPDALARAALEALRWWKFDPYRVGGVATAVETTVAVEFKL